MTLLKPLFLLVGLAGVSACGPAKGELPRDLEAEAQRFAEAACAAREACSCDDNHFASRDACETEYVEHFMTQVDAGLTFNPDCFDALMLSESLTCTEWPWNYDYWGCPSLEGSAHEGDACGWHRELHPLYATECADGLYCNGGVCVQEIEPLDRGVGEPCLHELRNNCVSGAWCGDDGTCHAPVLAGEPCTDFRGCELGHYCAGLGANEAGTCTMMLELGDACDPRDWRPCNPAYPESSWTWCSPSDSGYVCQPQIAGICLLTFPLYPS